MCSSMCPRTPRAHAPALLHNFLSTEVQGGWSRRQVQPTRMRCWSASQNVGWAESSHPCAWAAFCARLADKSVYKGMNVGNLCANQRECWINFIGSKQMHIVLGQTHTRLRCAQAQKLRCTRKQHEIQQVPLHLRFTPWLGMEE